MTQDFAKLFWVDGIGQILVTLAESDDQRPAVMFRIPDVGDAMATMTMTMTMPGKDDNYEAEEKLVRAVFDSVTQDTAGKAVQPLVKMRDSLFAQDATK